MGLSFIVIFLIGAVIFINFIKSMELQSSYIVNLLKVYFTNVEKIYSTSNMSLYKGDKSGENFIFAVKNNYDSTFSLSDLTTVYEIAEKNHIHNRILVTESFISTSSPLYKKAKEYSIQTWSKHTLNRLVNFQNETSKYNGSFLKTSDTSDDNCEIDEPNDPIQDGTFNTHSIFSFFGDKPDRL